MLYAHHILAQQKTCGVLQADKVVDVSARLDADTTNQRVRQPATPLSPPVRAQIKQVGASVRFCIRKSRVQLYRSSCLIKGICPCACGSRVAASPPPSRVRVTCCCPLLRYPSPAPLRPPCPSCPPATRCPLRWMRRTRTSTRSWTSGGDSSRRADPACPSR